MKKVRILFPVWIISFVLLFSSPLQATQEKFTLVGFSNLLTWYHYFLDKYPSDANKYKKQDWPRDYETRYEEDPKNVAYDYKTLDIGLDYIEMENVFQRTGFLQLRDPSKREKHLVIGCGNSPLSNDGGYPADESYTKNHHHKDAVTVDPDLAKKPTIVGFLGYGKLPELLEGQKFKQISLEGFRFIDTKKQWKALKEILDLLKDDGILATFGAGEVAKYEPDLKKLKEIAYAVADRKELERIRHADDQEALDKILG